MKIESKENPEEFFEKSLKFATFCRPHTGGTWTVANNLHKGLKKYGIEVRWLRLSHEEVPSDFAQSLDWTDTVQCLEKTPEAISQAYFDHLYSNGYDGVFVDILARPIPTNLLKFLPDDRLLKIAIIHNITPGTYAIANRYSKWTHAVVCVSSRITEDLRKQTGMSDERCLTIPNSVDLSAYRGMKPDLPHCNALRLLSLGRLEEASKGVLWIPDILARLNKIAWRMTIVGDGPAREKLKKACSPFKDRVRFMGEVPHSEVPSLFNSHDVFLMPSRYEGFGLTLVEAQAAGCVPIASRIRSVTDEIITHGENGFLFTVGCTEEAALAIIRLSDQRILAMMKPKCMDWCAGQFSLEKNALQYATLIRKLLYNRPRPNDHLSMQEWKIHVSYIDKLRTAIPEFLKNWFRMIRSRY